MSDNVFIVMWWMAQCPYMAAFENEVAAEAAANVRNAVFMEIDWKKRQIVRAVDYYRRDDKGNPMPFDVRDIVGQIHMPWLAGASNRLLA